MKEEGVSECDIKERERKGFEQHTSREASYKRVRGRNC